MLALIDDQQKSEIERLLEPLKEGKAIVLSVSDEDMQKRRRVPNPRLVITPIATGELCFALESFGCEIQQPNALEAKWLWKLGLTMRSSRILISKIQSTLFDIQEN